MFSNLKAIWDLMRGQRAMYGAAIAAMVVASVLLYLGPFVPQLALDGVLTDEPELASDFVQETVVQLGGREYLADNLWVLGAILVAITVFAGGFTYLRARLSASASESIIRRLRDRVYDHLQRLPARYFDKAETGDLIQRCTSDVDTVRVFLENQVVEVGRALIMIAVPIPLMLAIDPRMTLAATVLLPLVLGFSAVFFLKVKKAFTSTDEAEGKLTATLQENLTGIRVVRAFARQDHECERFDGDNGTHRNEHYRLYDLLAWYWSSTDLLTMLQKAIVVGYGLYLLASGELLIGALFYFLTATTMFVYPVRMLGRILTDLGKAMVALGRLREILDTPTESEPAKPVVPTLPMRGELSFQNVSFEHEGVPVLHDVSLEVHAGQTIGILGPSGCGKSTLINLLLRLYDHDTGSITIDGIDVKSLDRQLLRSQTAIVMQQPFLYSKTLAENVTLGRPGAHDDEMVEATRTACVHEAILEFEDGYGTKVGERGATLSGGQRQRVALARALLQQPAVLILDDALSAVDTETETMILRALAARQGRHTTIVIAHRLSSLMRADQILVLEHGRIVQRGNHAELVGQDGLYRRLWDIQSGNLEPKQPAQTATASKGGA
jgi:ATP-binding cassette subfamily B protein